MVIFIYFRCHFLFCVFILLILHKRVQAGVDIVIWGSPMTVVTFHHCCRHPHCASWHYVPTIPCFFILFGSAKQATGEWSKTSVWRTKPQGKRSPAKLYDDFEKWSDPSNQTCKRTWIGDSVRAGESIQENKKLLSFPVGLFRCSGKACLVQCFRT